MLGRWLIAVRLESFCLWKAGEVFEKTEPEASVEFEEMGRTADL